MKNLLVLALGSNLGDRHANLLAAQKLLRGCFGECLALSPVLETSPVGVSGPQPDYLNQVVVFASNFSPEEILNRTQEIERQLGRQSKGDLKSRTIDIDVLVYGQHQINMVDFSLPHPRMWERDFVVIPLKQVLPGIQKPAS